MMITAYLCDGIVCDAVAMDLDRTCTAYGVDYSVCPGDYLRDGRLAEAKGMGPHVAAHHKLLQAAGWDGELPAFVLGEPIDIGVEPVQAFGGEGWPAFCRWLRANKAAVS